jgi:hypothetical protein
MRVRGREKGDAVLDQGSGPDGEEDLCCEKKMEKK